MRKLCSLIVIILFHLQASSQFGGHGIPLFTGSYGGSAGEAASSIAATNVNGQNGYIIAGLSFSPDAPGHHGGNNADYYVIKINSEGVIQWEKSFGGSSDDMAKGVIATADGGYIVAGISQSVDGDVSGHHGDNLNTDCWVIKLDENGNIVWEKSLGGEGSEEGYSMVNTPDSGVVIAAAASTVNGDVESSHGDPDGWIVKLDKNGGIVWQKSLGGVGFDYINKIQDAGDGGFIAAGYSTSNDGDVDGHHGSADSADCWVMKLSSTGDIQWQKSFGGSREDVANSIDTIPNNGGYIVAGYSLSNDGDVSGHHGSENVADYWIVRLDINGNIVWQKSLGGTGDDKANAVEIDDDGFIIAGSSISADGDVTLNMGNYDFWVVRLDADGNITWKDNYGGPNADYAWDIEPAGDGNFFVAGATRSNSGDVSGNHSGDSDESDAWVIKIKPGSLLPVKLVSFNGVLKSNTALLTWQTATEQNSSHFNIQRSTDGSHFTTAGTVQAAGTSTIARNYSFTDNVSTIINQYPAVFYRLQQADKDGKTGYSNIIKLALGSKAVGLSIWPNPVTSELKLHISNYVGKTQAFIFDAAGHRLQAAMLDVAADGTVTMNTARLPAGVYILSAMVNGKMLQQKFIKK